MVSRSVTVACACSRDQAIHIPTGWVRAPWLGTFIQGLRNGLTADLWLGSIAHGCKRMPAVSPAVVNTVRRCGRDDSYAPTTEDFLWQCRVDANRDA